MAENPVISDDPNQYQPSLLDELLANIATLSSGFTKLMKHLEAEMPTVQEEVCTDRKFTNF